MTGDEILAWLEKHEAQTCCDKSDANGKVRFCVWLEHGGWSCGATLREAVEARMGLQKHGEMKTAVIAEGDY